MWFLLNVIFEGMVESHRQNYWSCRFDSYLEIWNLVSCIFTLCQMTIITSAHLLTNAAKWNLGDVRIEKMLVSCCPSDRFGDQEFSKEFLMAALCSLACQPVVQPLCLLYWKLFPFSPLNSVRYWVSKDSTDCICETVLLVVAAHKVAMDTTFCLDDLFPWAPMFIYCWWVNKPRICKWMSVSDNCRLQISDLRSNGL